MARQTAASSATGIPKACAGVRDITWWLMVGGYKPGKPAAPVAAPTAGCIPHRSYTREFVSGSRMRGIPEVPVGLHYSPSFPDGDDEARMVAEAAIASVRGGAEARSGSAPRRAPLGRGLRLRQSAGADTGVAASLATSGSGVHGRGSGRARGRLGHLLPAGGDDRLVPGRSRVRHRGWYLLRFRLPHALPLGKGRERRVHEQVLEPGSVYVLAGLRGRVGSTTFLPLRNPAGPWPSGRSGRDGRADPPGRSPADPGRARGLFGVAHPIP